MHTINTTQHAHAEPPAHTRQNAGNARMAGHVPHYNTDSSQHNGQEPRPASFASQLRAAPQNTQSQKDNQSGFGLDSVIDTINPLQHLPIVGTIYREMTGDDLGPVARVAGGALYGGAVGAAIGSANAAVEYSSGDDITGHAMAMLDARSSAPHMRSSAPANTPEARIANAMAAHGHARDEALNEMSENTSVRSHDKKQAHIRQSSYNG